MAGETLFTIDVSSVQARPSHWLSVLIIFGVWVRKEFTYSKGLQSQVQ